MRPTGILLTAQSTLGGTLSCVTQPNVLPCARGPVSKTFMLHALIFIGAHAVLLVVVLLVG